MDDTNTSFLKGLQNLKKQGQMSRVTAPKCALVWATVVQSLPEEQMKFALNAAVDVLPHNANLHLRKKRKDPNCLLCKSNLHVLNNCSAARDLRKYNTVMMMFFEKSSLLSNHI